MKTGDNIKPLRWVKDDQGFHSNTPFGKYYVDSFAEGLGSAWECEFDINTKPYLCASVAEAKLRAQEHWEKLVRKCLN